MMRHTLITQHFKERIGCRNSHTSDVVLCVTRMNARRAVECLRDRSRWLYGGDRHRRLDAKSRGVRCVRCNCDIAHCTKRVGLPRGVRVPLTRYRYPQEGLFFAVFCPVGRNVFEGGERGLVCTNNRGEARFAHQRLLRIISARNHLGKVAELFRLQDDFAARVCADGTVNHTIMQETCFLEVSRSPRGQRLVQRTTVENPPLARSTFHERNPFIHEFRTRRPTLIHSGIIRHHAMRLGEEKLPLLCVAQLSVVEVRQTNHCRAPNPAGNDAFTDLANNVVRIDGSQTSSLSA